MAGFKCLSGVMRNGYPLSFKSVYGAKQATTSMLATQSQGSEVGQLGRLCALYPYDNYDMRFF